MPRIRLLCSVATASGLEVPTTLGRIYRRQHLGGKGNRNTAAYERRNPPRRRNQIRKRTPRKRADVHSADPAQTRGNVPSKAVAARYRAGARFDQIRGHRSFRRWLEHEVDVLSEECVDLRVVSSGSSEQVL